MTLLNRFLGLALCAALACGDDPVSQPEGTDPGDDTEDDDTGNASARDAGRLDARTPQLDASGLKDTSTPADDSAPPRQDASTEGKSAQGCEGANLLPAPEDPGERGPWDVGVRTVKIGRLTVEVMYPAQPGSTAGKPEATYDIREFLPERERSKVPDEAVPAVGPIGGHLHRDVPIDGAHGPYPLIVFIHGTASFRIASGTTNVQWASRGFVVLAADYPGLGLHDQVASTLECGLPTTGAQDIPGDVNLQLNALKAPSGDLAFLGDRVDTKRIGISGHSQGACVSATLSKLPGVEIVLPFDGSYPVEAAPNLKSVMFAAGMSDTVIGYDFPRIGNVVCPLFSSTTQLAYDGSPGPTQVKKRLVGITGGGHLTPTDLCQTNKFDRNAVQQANENGVCGINSAVIIGLPALFDCGVQGFDWQVGVKALNYATTAALEETLHCRDQTAQFAAMKTKQPVIGQFLEAIK